MAPVATVRIGSIAAGGAGVGKLPDGRAIFVQRTAPGDEAIVEVTREKKRWASGKLLRVLTPGPGRRVAPCRHYEHCGGCTLEHLEYPQQLAAKAEIVRETLRRIGGIVIDTPVVTPSTREFRYRNRLSFTLVRTMTGQVLAGFHDIDRPDRVVDISEDCLLPEEPITQAWGELRRGWGKGAAFLPSGEQLRLTLRATAEGNVALVIDGGYSQGQPAQLLQNAPAITALWHRPRGAQDFTLLAGDAAVRENWRSEEIELSGSMFLQVNRGTAELLEQHVLERVQHAAPETIVDAYCGVGLHARRLLRLGYGVTGIELEADAVQEARRAAPEAAFVIGRVEDTIAAHLPADLVIVNPPRTGLAPAAAQALVHTPPRTLLYVSCDAATLARDLSLLAGAFTTASVRCFDLFPQTAHVETVVELKCATS